ncbi:hypothetical protein [Candidatus Mesenet endosymbiont of Agriotes lineatus]|uniref:hypothetical protein n=1 Tax=Candidatus Mesenet endosymbiont of Agriotes lineatus TaxID=3077948 RepID=UPI0030D400D8
MLRVKNSKYSFHLYVKNSKSGKVSYHDIDNFGMYTACGVIFIIVPHAIIAVFMMIIDKKDSQAIAMSCALVAYFVCTMIFCALARYCITCTLDRCVKLKGIHTQADNSIEDKDVLEELTCHNVIKHDVMSSEKFTQTDITMTEFRTDIEIASTRDYDIPNVLRTGSGLVTVDDLFQRKIDNLNSTTLENGKSKPKGPKSSVSADTGITDHSIISSEGLLEQAGPSASKSMVLENTVLEGHNINVSKDVVVHAPFNSYQSSLDTDLLKAQVTK